MASQNDILSTVLSEIQAMRVEGRETQRAVHQLAIKMEPLEGRLAHVEEDVKANGVDIGTLSAWRWRMAGVIAVMSVLVGWPLQALAADVLAR